MRIKSIAIQNHPGIGDLNISFEDDDGRAYSTVILAGGNGCGKTTVLEIVQSCFEGSYDRNFGVVDIVIEFDEREEIDFRNLLGDQVPSGSREMQLTWVSSSQSPSTAYHLEFYDEGRTSTIRNYWIGGNTFPGLFKTFFSHAETSFNVGSPGSITSMTIDRTNLRNNRAAGGQVIAQLLVDVRAADSEDLNEWVTTHPGMVPPAEVRDVRFGRFRDAFNYMFPTKRFKGIRRADALIIEFEEFGRTSQIDNLSTGEKQIVFRAGFLLRDLAATSGAIILIDEPELSLHPEWQQKILGFYERLLSDEHGCHPQLLVATHSPFIVHGSASAKTVILQKDHATGQVTQMPSPAYPAVKEAEAVRAFNIDAFLSQARKPLLVLTEGESDSVILQAAWKALHPSQPQPFETRAALGSKNLNITLNDDQLFNKLGERLVVGLFDFDTAYNQWHGVWKNGELVCDDISQGLVKKHRSRNGWSMLLPVPSFRSGYASKELGGRSILSIEFLFPDRLIPREMIGQTPMALGASTPHFLDSYKSSFASLVAGFESDAFEGFTPLFARFQSILGQ